MTLLSINLNKIALLRNSRGDNFPDLLAYAQQTLELGVHGLTVHPRPDQRHIRYDDLPQLKNMLRAYEGVELNIEGYPSDAFMSLVLEVEPDQVTFVPDPPEALTSSFGWDIESYTVLLKDVISSCKAKGIRSSLFVDKEFSQWSALSEVSADRIELYTGSYASEYQLDKYNAVAPYRQLGESAKKYDVELNAGHDLNQENLAFFLDQVSGVKEVSIGHAVICEALQFGWEATINAYLKLVKAK